MIIASFSIFLIKFIELDAKYNIVLVLPYIDMNPPWVYMCSPSWTPSHLPPHPIPLGHSKLSQAIGLILHLGFLGGLIGKTSTCNAGDLG